MSNATKLLLVASVVVLFQNWERIGLWLDPPELKRDAGPVILYATSWCGYCAKTRKLFALWGVNYEERDIERSDAAKAEFDALGGGGVPVVVIGDEVIRGYEPERFKALLLH